jgi:hypothetical protein
VIDDQLLREYAEAVRSDVTAPPVASVRTRAKRRRSRHVAAAGVVAIAVVAAGVIVPIALLHNGSGAGRRTQVVIASPSPTPSTSTRYSLPALGAAGFPASVYPLPHRGRKPGTIASCPNTNGLQLSTPSSRQQAVDMVRQLETRSFSSDLHNTDRAYWPGIQAGWEAHHDWQTPSAPRKLSRVYILESGRLLGLDQPTSVRYLGRYVREACGEGTLRDTIVAIYGSAPNLLQARALRARALQSADLFVVRAGRPLLYFSYP